MMEQLTSASGSLAVAITALLLVLGYRLARPSRGREWLALTAYAAALAAQLAGAGRFVPGKVFAAGPALRLAGAALLLAGIIVAGAPSRAQRRARIARRHPTATRRSVDPAYIGLALVLVGQLARAPSTAGAIVTSGAVAICLVGSARGREEGARTL